ncbi:MAG: DUF4384 domain-containing protein [Spirochaetes bacterium]|nr:DUF4384 domain-containing protein [Spirochaetota bacterium]MBU0956693.1 DUF4384 domain-containing protein [Spirochaetota bacterium]
MKINQLKVVFPLVLALNFFGLAAQLKAQPSLLVDPAVLLDTMADRHYMPMVNAAFGTFTWEYSDLPTPFARWLEDSLLAATSRTKRVALINRNAAAAMDPAFRQQYEQFFLETGTDALLHGRYFLEGDQVRVRLELTDLNTAGLIGTADWYVPLPQVPAYAAVRPIDSTMARSEELVLLGTLALPASGIAGNEVDRLKVSLTTDRGAGASYRNGEQLTVLLSVNQDAWVRLYHIDSAGQMQLIWPNRFGGGDGKLRSGAVIRLPGSADPFRFDLNPPYGTEFLKAIASNRPFADSQNDFTDLGSNYRSTITRGLVVASTGEAQAGGQQIAEALASYYIGP